MKIPNFGHLGGVRDQLSRGGKPRDFTGAKKNMDTVMCCNNSVKRP